MRPGAVTAGHPETIAASLKTGVVATFTNQLALQVKPRLTPERSQSSLLRAARDRRMQFSSATRDGRNTI
jgi:hypothetical protein